MLIPIKVHKEKEHRNLLLQDCGAKIGRILKTSKTYLEK